MTMRDRFDREITYLRVSVTEACNLRCRYCMPENAVCNQEGGHFLSPQELVRAVRIASELGIRKIRLTGGEPLASPDILPICRGIAALPGIDELCITTNGILMPRYAAALREAGVTRVNMSLDTLDREKYAYMTGRDRFDAAMEGLAATLAAGFEKVKINTVLVGGFNDNEIRDIAGLTVKYPVDVRFIELMPMPGSKEFGPDAFVDAAAVLDAMPEAEPVASRDAITRLYRLPGAGGMVGIISPVSCNFCDRCNRLRLTADGKLKPCLHSRDEISIAGLSDGEIRQRFLEAVAAKPQEHPPLSFENRSEAARAMNRIGG